MKPLELDSRTARPCQCGHLTKAHVEKQAGQPRGKCKTPGCECVGFRLKEAMA